MNLLTHTKQQEPFYNQTNTHCITQYKTINSSLVSCWKHSASEIHCNSGFDISRIFHTTKSLRQCCCWWVTQPMYHKLFIIINIRMMMMIVHLH